MNTRRVLYCVAVASWMVAAPCAPTWLTAQGTSTTTTPKTLRLSAPKKVGACPAIDTTASWSRRQREWLDERGAKWSDDALRATLLKVTGVESADRSGAMLGYEIADAARTPLSASDSSALDQLRKLATSRGSTWPVKSVVGARGVLAVWVLVAHDTTLAKSALRRMMEAGPDESPPTAVAILDDRQRIRAGRKQLYGTQLHRGTNGQLEPLPIEDEAHLALRRDGAELPPLAQSLCAAQAVYH